MPDEAASPVAIDVLLFFAAGAAWDEAADVAEVLSEAAVIDDVLVWTLSPAEVLLSPEPAASPLLALPLSLRARRGRFEDLSTVSLDPLPDEVELYRSDVAWARDDEEPEPEGFAAEVDAAWNDEEGVFEAWIGEAMADGLLL